SSSGSPATGYTRVIVREEKDQDFAITFNGYVGEGGMPVQIFAPNSVKFISETVSPGLHFPYKITVPRDGITGQYVIFLKDRDAKETLRVPLTTLPGEVYYQPKGIIWSQSTPTRLFTRSYMAQTEIIEIQPYSNLARIEEN